MGLFSKLKDQLSKVQQENRENAKEKTAPKEVFDRMRQKIEEVQKKQQTKKGRTRKTGSIFGKIKTKLEEAQKENAASPTEATAEASILDRIQAEVDNLEKQKDTIEIETKRAETPAWGTPTSTPTADSILDAIMGKAKKTTSTTKKTTSFEPTNMSTTPTADSILDAVMGKVEKTKAPKKEEDFGSIFDQIMEDKPKASSTTKSSSTNAPDFGTVFEEVVSSNNDGASQASMDYASPKVARNTSLYVGGTALVDGKGGSLAMRSSPNMGASQNGARLPDNVNVRIVDYTDKNAINIDGVVAGWYQVDYNGQRGWLLSTYLE